MLANGVAPEFIFIGCFTPFLVLLAVTLIEALVAAPIMRVPWRQTFSIWLAANTASTLGGLIVLWSFGGQFLFWTFVLEPNFPADPLVRSAPRLAAYFIQSVLVEAIVWRFAQRHRPTLSPQRCQLAVVAANAVSYALLIPLLAISLR